MQQSVHHLHTFVCVLLSGVLAFAPLSQASAQKNKPASPSLPKLTEQQKAIHLLERITFGPRPGDVEAVQRMGWERYLEQQLNPEKMVDGALAQRLQPLTTIMMSSAEIAQVYDPPPQVLLQLRDKIEQPNQAAQANETRTTTTSPINEQAKNIDLATSLREDPAKRRQYQQALAEMGYKPRQIPIMELQAAKILRAVYSERQMQEVLTDFWFNHFNIYAQKGADRVLLTAYERDVIRPNVFGKFEDLLLATAKSPAMLFYLDNWMSTAPNAKLPNLDQLRQMRQQRQTMTPNVPRPAAGRGLGRRAALNQEQAASGAVPPAAQPKRTRGINENYAREIMELHTLGVDGGYTQKDVQEIARCFTGWTMRQPRQGGGFFFAPFMHDDGEKIVLGQKIPAGGGIKDGETVIKILARHPATAKFIATKLARKFVTDTPPPALVDKLAQAFLKSDGDLRQVYRTLFTATEFWAPENYRAKIKTPFEMIVSAVRALGAETNAAPALHRWMQQMGEGLFLAQPPTGYKDEAELWVNTGALLERMNFSLALTGNKIFGTQVTFAPQLKNAKPTEVADYFIQNILHGNISAGTRATLDRTLSDPAIVARNNTDVAKIAGLILGSPEFQRQ